MINDCKDSNGKNCCLYAICTQKNKWRLFVIAIKKINKQDEFFLDYGKKYWLQK